MKTQLEIKKQIKDEYKKWIQRKIEISESVLSNPNWANSGSNYHIQCRERTKLEVKFFKSLLNKIK